MRRALLLLPLLLVAATFYADEGFTANGFAFTATVGSSHESLFLSGEYYDMILRVGDCEAKDIYKYCLDAIDHDPVEHYPHEHRINITVTALCTDCAAYGKACTERRDCSGVCLHGLCRPKAPWCGDAVCDSGEACAADCPVNETVSEQNVTTDIPAEEPEAVAPAVEEEDIIEPPASATIEDVPAPAPVRARQEDAAPASVAKPVNWLGVGLTVGVGLALLVAVFRRKRTAPQPI